jgi:hypothetical protein
MPSVVGIHQPNFFPWLGYFDKIARADAFVFLNDVQFPKKGGSWSNRVRLLVGSEPRWMTAPVDRSYAGTRTIREMRFSDAQPWRERILRSLDASYGKHPFHDSVREVVDPLIAHADDNVAEYNMHCVRALASRLGLDTHRLLVSSELEKSGSSNEMLATLTIAAGGTTYLCGGGAEGYQVASVFEAHCVELKHQSFRHPEYAQAGTEPFVAGLSVIDALMNLGWAGVAALLEPERSPS